MINVQKVSKQFSGSYALKDFSFRFKQGESYALLGTNGAGKSTLIKSLMGLISLDAGEIEGNHNLAYLPEHAHLPESMTPWQLVTYACKIHGSDFSSTGKFLQEVELKSKFWQQPISGFSKGMKQRVSIAYVLAATPEWFILDEPMSGLDVMGRSLVLDIFKRRSKAGCGIIMSSHAVSDIVKLCDHVLIMVNGELKEIRNICINRMSQVGELERRLMYWHKYVQADK